MAAQVWRLYFLYRPQTTIAKLNVRADKSNANLTTDGDGLEWTCINTHYSNAHSVWKDATRIVGLVWTGLLSSNCVVAFL